MKAEYLTHKDGTRFVPITQPDAVIDSEGKSLTTTLADMEEEIKSKGSGGNVDDVQVDGTSVVTNKVAKITMPTSLPASDVSSWAKASTKPSYTASEIAYDDSTDTASAINEISRNFKVCGKRDMES